MEFLTSLWLPILVSGLAVFVMSAIAWTALPTHKKEFSPLANEGAVSDALRAGIAGPGRYVVPHMMDQKAMGSPEGKARLEKGPIAYITVAPNGVPAMGPMMAQSTLSALVISLFTAYVAWHTLRPGAEYLEVFRVTGTITFMTYALGGMSESIWFARPWKSFFLQAFDALLYAGVAAGVFGWLWPR
jgi:hypothetical protein